MAPMSIQKILSEHRIIPVVVLHDVNHALPLARALIKGGIHILEITLRTPAATDCIQTILENLPDCTVGAGTVIEPYQLKTLKNIKAHFAVSPGLTPALATAAKEYNVPFLPGASTCSEIMQANTQGYDHLKFFPAGISGGVKALKYFHDVFPHLQFCPTGGVSAQNMNEYLALENVPAIGGTWLCPPDLIEKEQWDTITELAETALGALP